jgi:hypothetical protein
VGGAILAFCLNEQVFAGFVDVNESKTSDGSWEATACKPVWDAGAAVPLSLKKKKATAPAPAPAKKVWTISADDGEDLMDQDSLLNDEELKPTPKAADDWCNFSTVSSYKTYYLI